MHSLTILFLFDSQKKLSQSNDLLWMIEASTVKITVFNSRYYTSLFSISQRANFSWSFQIPISFLKFLQLSHKIQVSKIQLLSQFICSYFSKKMSASFQVSKLDIFFSGQIVRDFIDCYFVFNMAGNALQIWPVPLPTFSKIKLSW